MTVDLGLCSDEAHSNGKDLNMLHSAHHAPVTFGDHLVHTPFTQYMYLTARH